MQRRKQDVSGNWKSSSRGERAWKEVVEDLASRNADARKAGRSERQAYEREREDAGAPRPRSATRLLARRTPNGWLRSPTKRTRLLIQARRRVDERAARAPRRRGRGER